jgi:hypothetical protein
VSIVKTAIGPGSSSSLKTPGMMKSQSERDV